MTNMTEYIPCSRFKLVVYSLKSREVVIYKEKKFSYEITWSAVHIKSEICKVLSVYKLHGSLSDSL